MSNITTKLLLRIQAFYLFVCVCAGACSPGAYAQSRPLPKAGFGNYSGGPSVPGSGGVTLTGGEYRAPSDANKPYSAADPEPPLNGKLVRWEPKQFPLKVWISPGLQLPPEPLSAMTARPTEVLQMLQTNPQSLLQLPVCSNWSPTMSQAAKTGIEQWKELQMEGVVGFEFVDQPWGANVLVFWMNQSPETGPGGAAVHANTATAQVDIAQLRQLEAQGKPVLGPPCIIEMQCHDDVSKLQAECAHEFGHALGIKAHSPYTGDIMFVNRMVPFLSPADKATLRSIYRQPPQYVFLSPYAPNVTMTTSRSAPEMNQSQMSGGGGYEPGRRPDGGYKIHVSRSGRTPDFSATTTDDSSSSAVTDTPSRPAPVPKRHDDSDSYSGENRTSPDLQELRSKLHDIISGENTQKESKAKESKKSKDNSKHRKDSESAPSAAPDTQEQAPDMRPRASEGY